MSVADINNMIILGVVTDETTPRKITILKNRSNFIVTPDEDKPNIFERKIDGKTFFVLKMEYFVETATTPTRPRDVLTDVAREALHWAEKIGTLASLEYAWENGPELRLQFETLEESTLFKLFWL